MMKHNGGLVAYLVISAVWIIILFFGALLVLDDFDTWSRLASSIIVGLLLGWVTWRLTRPDA